EYEDENEELKMYSDLLMDSGKRLLRTLGSILDLSRLEEDGSIELENVKVLSLIQETMQEHEQEAMEKGLPITIKVEDPEVCLALNPAFFQQTMAHLLSNAIKFTDEGQIEVSLRKSDTGLLRISVSDSGIGMSEQFVSEKLFMKFEQESEGLDRNYEGAGLGLSIAKRVVEMMNGSIRVKSIKGEGSTFWMDFPIVPEQTFAITQ
ncbi:MAG: ATP-binding protein, partial [Bacteroidota bacterium]